MRKATEDDEAAVKEALMMAGVYDKVNSLPQGMKTILTREFAEDGSVLSGGEYQKIVVARAFVKASPFKIFDEPSSALDPIAEYELFEQILQSGKDKTMLFISHRLSSVQNADYVFMLEKGTVVEEGNHRELPYGADERMVHLRSGHQRLRKRDRPSGRQGAEGEGSLRGPRVEQASHSPAIDEQDVPRRDKDRALGHLHGTRAEDDCGGRSPHIPVACPCVKGRQSSQEDCE